MARISETNKGRKDGGFTRLFEDPELGSLISQVHATLIRAGTELEDLIAKHARCMSEAEALAFLNNNLIPDTYLITKKTLKKIIKPRLKPSLLIPSSASEYEKKLGEPDFIVVVVVGKQCHVIELKDGDAFDTKKSEGEVAKLEKFSTALQDLKADYSVDWKVCFFHACDKSEIVSGFKGRISNDNAITGKEFCDMLRISYETIETQRRTDAPENIKFFFKSLLEIPISRVYIREA